MRAIVVVLVALLGLAEVWQLKQKIDAQQTENGALRQRNQQLEAEVRDLKEGLAAAEERAREELGMVKRGEVFYLVVEESSADGQPPLTAPNRTTQPLRRSR